ncbi:4Fe-4S binding protein [Parabacteroides sp. PF5-9]|uniref:4Fe-4S binding protein n=1 Tax=Parabacteroides sp. PF5-9 TaxID=1742404 RepID=UPI002474946B|nr:4Fe-4S binding protein [Parabacteroides sp. PF5-9]MDH6358612.1 ferredoxin [Parabacteroides sp. PF5-9]
MSKQTLHLIYFSPTHTSKKITHAIADGMQIPIQTDWDLTYKKNDPLQLETGLAIVAVPVYGGRVSETALERLKKIKATQIPVVPIVVYGNRDYEDALFELSDTLKEQGFIPIAAGAFVGEHSFSTKEMPIAAGRPDNEDLEKARHFGEEIKNITNLSSPYSPTLKIKGNFPYKEKGPHTPQAPETDSELCILCESCIDLCPTDAISVQDNTLFSDAGLCIKCCACVKECPENARSFETPFRAYLHTNFATRREPELFL